MKESPKAITIDAIQVEKDLKNCPQSVQDYVKALERSRASWRLISEKAINKLKQKP